MQSVSSSNGRENGQPVQDDSSIHNFLEAKRLGFRALLGWHYLILFAPLLVTGGTGSITQLVMSRQLVLYVALAVTFAVLFVVELRFKKVKNFVSSPGVIASACVLGAGTTFVAGFTFDMGFWIYGAVTVVLGASEAVLMLAWLYFFIELAKVQAYRTLGLDIIIGSLVAILVESLVTPANFVIAACLPLLCALSFLSLRKRYEESKRLAAAQASQEPASADGGADGSQAEDRRQKTAFRYLLRRSVPTALFALAFGLMQGSFLSSGTMFLIAFNPLLFVGMTIAGIIIFFTAERFCTHSDVDTLYRLSLIFFMVGIIVLMLVVVLMGSPDAFHPQVTLVVLGIAIFAGFNLFDYGNMMMSLGITRAQGGKYAYFVVGGRCIVYVCMALGFGVGHVFVSWAFPLVGSGVLMVICCVALLALIFTASVSSMSAEDYAALLVSISADNLSDEAENGEARPCEYCSSSGNCTIRPVLLSSISAAARAIAKEAELSEALNKLADSAKRREESLAAKYSQNSKNGSGGGSSIQEGSAEGAQSRHTRAPWRDACNEVAKRYRLSKRETQIFMLISKGRNAEYVSQELVISIHTAKTHIANIYQKLDVHSSQEMLDLIDTFRAYADEEEQQQQG